MIFNLFFGRPQPWLSWAALKCTSGLSDDASFYLLLLYGCRCVICSFCHRVIRLCDPSVGSVPLTFVYPFFSFYPQKFADAEKLLLQAEQRYASASLNSSLSPMAQLKARGRVPPSSDARQRELLSAGVRKSGQVLEVDEAVLDSPALGR